MLITPDFVFLHVPKTGGVFMRSVIAKHFETQETAIWHGGVRRIPAEARHLPRFMLVRNPWDWHVSWFAYMSLKQPEVVEEDFGAFLHAHLDLYMRVTRSVDDPQTDVGRHESLALDFAAFLKRHGISEPEGLRADLFGPRQNTSERNGYRDYYNATTRDLVANSCAPLIRRFGYRF